MRNKRCIESWLDCQTIQYGMTSESVRHVKIWQVKQFNCKKTSRRYVTKMPIYIKGIHYIIYVKKIWISLTIRVQKVYWVHGLSNLWFVGPRTIGSMALEPSILFHGIFCSKKTTRNWSVFWWLFWPKKSYDNLSRLKSSFELARSIVWASSKKKGVKKGVFVT